MVKHEISIKIGPEFKELLKTARIKKVIVQILEAVPVNGIVELSVVFIDTTTIQELNRQYRNIDSPTDVLAFQMYPDERIEEVNFITPPDSLHHLGEVVISYPQAVSQAREFGHSIDSEVKVLLIHGILHLLGYDHMQTEEEEAMRIKEEEILEKLELSGD